VRPAYLVTLLASAAAVGSQYMFIRVAVEELDPAFLAGARLAIAVPFIVAIAVRIFGSAAWSDLRRAGRPGLAIGVLNAVPFTLVAWAETRVDSGIAAVTLATIPIFVVMLVALFVPAERVTGLRLVGFALGVVGVAIMAGLDPGASKVNSLGLLALLVAAASFAGSQVYSRVKLDAFPGPVLAAAGMTGALLLLVPFALASLPSHAPSLKAVSALIALALVSTAAAQLLFYRMIRLYGIGSTTLGGYLVPVAGLCFGSLFLAEPFTVRKVVGLVVTLLAVALGSGAFRPRRAQRVAL